MNAITLPRIRLATGGFMELLNLRIIRQGFGVASIRLPAVYLRCLLVTKRQDGKIEIKPPRVINRSGINYCVSYAPSPAAREAIEQALAILWAQAEEGGNGA